MVCSFRSWRSSALTMLSTFLKSSVQVVEHGAERLLVFHAAVELGEHLVGVVDRRDGLVGAGVRHASPGVGPVGDHHAELERAEAGARFRFRLQEVFEFLVERNAFGPAGGSVGAALDVAGEQLGAGEKAADAAHVVVAVAADAIGDAFKDERPVLKQFEWLEDFLEFEIVAGVVGPELFGEHAVGTEDDDQALAARDDRRGEAEAWQVENERNGGGADAEVAEEIRGGR